MLYFFGFVALVAGVIFLALKTTFFGWLLALFLGALAFLAGSFVLWSFGFWAVIVLGSILIICSIDEGEMDYRYCERHMNSGGTAAAFTVVAVLVLFQFFGDVKVFSYLYHHPLSALGWLAAYVVCGAIWSLVKWTLFSLSCRDAYRDQKQKFLEENKVPGDVIPQELKDKWRERAERFSVQKPEHRRYKHAITKWMIYWPWSVLWAVLDDFVRKMYRRIYELLGSLYQRISNHIWHDVEKDFS